MIEVGSLEAPAEQLIRTLELSTLRRITFKQRIGELILSESGNREDKQYFADCLEFVRSKRELFSGYYEFAESAQFPECFASVEHLLSQKELSGVVEQYYANQRTQPCDVAQNIKRARKLARWCNADPNVIKWLFQTGNIPLKLAACQIVDILAEKLKNETIKAGNRVIARLKQLPNFPDFLRRVTVNLQLEYDDGSLRDLIIAKLDSSLLSPQTVEFVTAELAGMRNSGELMFILEIITEYEHKISDCDLLPSVNQFADRFPDSYIEILRQPAKMLPIANVILKTIEQVEELVTKPSRLHGVLSILRERPTISLENVACLDLLKRIHTLEPPNCVEAARSPTPKRSRAVEAGAIKQHNKRMACGQELSSRQQSVEPPSPRPLRARLEEKQKNIFDFALNNAIKYCRIPIRFPGVLIFFVKGYPSRDISRDEAISQLEQCKQLAERAGEEEMLYYIKEDLEMAQSPKDLYFFGPEYAGALESLRKLLGSAAPRPEWDVDSLQAALEAVRSADISSAEASDAYNQLLKLLRRMQGPTARKTEHKIEEILGLMSENSLLISEIKTVEDDEEELNINESSRFFKSSVARESCFSTQEKGDNVPDPVVSVISRQLRRPPAKASPTNHSSPDHIRNSKEASPARINLAKSARIVGSTSSTEIKTRAIISPARPVATYNSSLHESVFSKLSKLQHLYENPENKNVGFTEVELRKSRDLITKLSNSIVKTVDRSLFSEKMNAVRRYFILNCAKLSKSQLVSGIAALQEIASECQISI